MDIFFFISFLICVLIFEDTLLLLVFGFFPILQLFYSYITYSFTDEKNMTFMNLLNSIQDTTYMEAYFKMMIVNFTQNVVLILSLVALFCLEFKIIVSLIKTMSLINIIPQNQAGQYEFWIKIGNSVGVSFFINCLLLNLISKDENNLAFLLVCI